MLIEIIVKNEKGEVLAKRSAGTFEMAEAELGKLEREFKNIEFKDKDDYTIEDDEVDLSLEEKYWGYMPN